MAVRAPRPVDPLTSPTTWGCTAPRLAAVLALDVGFVHRHRQHKRLADAGCMKTILPVTILLGLLAGACTPSSEQQAHEEALQAQVRAQREELQRLRSDRDAERQTVHRAVADLQSRLAELDRTLRLASAEIWGDGSPTSARLAMAERTLAAIRAEVDGLAASLRAGRRGD